MKLVIDKKRLLELKKQGGLQLYLIFSRGLLRAPRALGALVGAVKALIGR